MSNVDPATVFFKLTNTINKDKNYCLVDSKSNLPAKCVACQMFDFRILMDPLVFQAL
jgi:hypothetical protein